MKVSTGYKGRRLPRIGLAVWLFLTLIVFSSVPLQADQPDVTHEDPQEAKTVYNGLSLLVYYSAGLDPVLDKDDNAARVFLAATPFANVPPELEHETQNFASGSIKLAVDLVYIYRLWATENELVSQYRLKEAAAVFQLIEEALPDAAGQIAIIRDAVEGTGDFLKIASTAPESEMRVVYAAILAKLDRLQDMLNLVRRPLVDFNFEESSRQSTELNLRLAQSEAFVGESIPFRISLTAAGQALSGRQVEVYLDNTLYTTLLTNAEGEAEGNISLPFRYDPVMQVQAVYYPQNEDNRRYLGSASAVETIDVLFYRAILSLSQVDNAYPGLNFTLKGVLDYGSAPPVERTDARLNLDDNPLLRFTAAPQFSLVLDIEAALIPGYHSLTVYIPADGRYAPVNADCRLMVGLAAVSTDFQMPGIGWSPGHLDFGARVYSEVGSLQNAAVEVAQGGNVIKGLTGPDGKLTLKLPLKAGINLLGNHSFSIQVEPQEPWNQSLKLEKTVFIINWLSCSFLLAVILALTILMRRRFKVPLSRQSKARPAVFIRPTGEAAQTAVQPAAVPPAEMAAGDGTAHQVILNLYRMVLKIIQKLTGNPLKPAQTLREYARQNQNSLGPLSHYFSEFTGIIEKELYSQQSAGTPDTERARQLTEAIRSREDSTNENL